MTDKATTEPPQAVPAERVVRPGAESPRWYCLSREGMATLCRNEEDARITAEGADMSWPGGAPHRAVMLVDVAERDAAFAMTRCECGADEACANLARMSAEIERLRAALVSVHSHAGWHADDDADPFDQSPDDMHSHVNGLIRQECAKALKPNV